MIMKTFAYVDGFNLYGGLMDKRYKIPDDNSEFPLRKYLWLHLHDFISSFLPKEYWLAQIKYFTAPIKRNPKKQERQQAFLKALSTLDNLSVILGKHISIGRKYSEKQTDVLMALHMYSDALNEDHKAIVLVSGDSDQVPTIDWIKSLDKGIEIHVVFPPYRVSKDLRSMADFHYRTKWKRLRKYQFPDPVVGKDFKVYKPLDWT
jgi:uncharacterized LabA/DUF88 family protein